LRYACLLAALAAVLVVPQASARNVKKETKLIRMPKVFVSKAAHARSLGEIERRRDAAWRWQRLMGKPRTPYGASAQESRSRLYHGWVLRLWEQRAARAWKQALEPPHKREWQCIHRYEGRWNDPNSPYYGGLQMDREFQRTYGPELLRQKGTADHWTPLEQMWVAERAYASGRGFYPWPNTARYCGLI
jgi:hypothetical protein